MKKLSLLLALILCLCSIGCNVETDGSAEPITENMTESVTEATGNTDEFEKLTEGDYTYVLDKGAAVITAHLNSGEANLVVPDSLGGNTVEIIASEAFYQHTELNGIVLPRQLKKIEGAAFYRCYSLTEITIPCDVEEITSNPFFRASSLEVINVASENEYFCSVDGVLFSEDKTEMICYPEGKTDEEYVIPGSVCKLNGDTFGYRTGIKRLTVYSTVTDLPDYNMFVYPEDITLIVEPDSAIYDYAVKHELNYELMN